MLVFVAGIFIGARAWRHNSAWLIPIALVALAYPHEVIIWHGNTAPAEIGRHSLAVRVQLNCAFWCMTLLALDCFVPRMMRLRASLGKIAEGFAERPK
jgi:hypothetical protein